jgi:hypothetical protein
LICSELSEVVNAVLLQMRRELIWYGLS